MTIWTNIFDSLDKYISNFGKYSESEVLNSSIISSLCQVRFPKEIQHLFKLCAHKTATQSLDLSNLSLNKKKSFNIYFLSDNRPYTHGMKSSIIFGLIRSLHCFARFFKLTSERFPRRTDAGTNPVASNVMMHNLPNLSSFNSLESKLATKPISKRTKAVTQMFS